MWEKKAGIKLMRVKRWPIKKTKSNPITLYKKKFYSEMVQSGFQKGSEIDVEYHHKTIMLSHF